MTASETIELINAIDAELGKLYRKRDALQAELADLQGPAVLPQPRHRTDRQQAVARCPRCGDKITAE
jgi:hypothetical protein